MQNLRLEGSYNASEVYLAQISQAVIRTKSEWEQLIDNVTMSYDEFEACYMDEYEDDAEGALEAKQNSIQDSLIAVKWDSYNLYWVAA